MIIILVLVGGLIGAVLFRETASVAGMVIGGGMGFLIATVSQLTDRVRKLEQASDSAVSAPGLSTDSSGVVPHVPEPVSLVADEPQETVGVHPAMPDGTSSPAVHVDTPTTTWPNLVGLIRDWFGDGKAIPRIGVIILFFGVAFLLKYASEHSLLPIEFRLGATALGAIVLLVIGWRLRETRAVYGLTLQGGGVGLIYLTLFAAFRLYGLLPPSFTFTAMALTAVLAGALAVLQNARALAVLGTAGGFLAPVLASTGGGSHVALFSYYALLNLGILGIAWFRAWRELNVLGFAFTFVIGSLWGVDHYRAELFGTTEPFLLLFFVFYVAIAILFALRQPIRLRGYVDGTLVFGVPVVAFALQAGLVHDVAYGLAWSAVGAAAFYIVIATILWRRRAGDMRLLCEAFLALGVVFATLALPLALEGRWTSAAWALEGAAIVWVGVRQQRLLARVFGALLIAGAGAFFIDDRASFVDGLPVLNGFYLGVLIVAFAALFAANRLRQSGNSHLRPWERWIGLVLFVAGLFWWGWGGLHEIGQQLTGSANRLSATIAFAAFSALVAEWVGEKVGWMLLRNVALVLLPVGLFLSMLTPLAMAHPLTLVGAPAWAAFAGVHLFVLARRDDIPSLSYRNFLHGATVWLIAWLGAQEFAWIGDQLANGTAWRTAGWGIGLALAAVAAVSLPVPRFWHERRDVYVRLGATPVLVVAGIWLMVATITSDGNPAPLPYVPLFNPLDLASILVLACIVQAALYARAQMSRDTRLIVVACTGVLAFLWVTTVLLRTLHYWGDVVFDYGVMFESTLVQSSLSIFWTALALIGMVVATRKHWRVLWMTGGSLLVLVVVKLFIVDLARSATLARIISFIVVGALLLLIGYLAPIPPAVGKEETAS